MIVDLFLVYNFLKRLATPFESWDAYKKGVIDKDGKILIAKRDRDNDQKKAFGVFDLMVLKLKKLIEKIPGSQASKMLASYAAALYLIKEHNMFQVGSVLSESVTEESLDSILEGFSNGYSDYTTSLELVNHLVEDSKYPTNSVGGGWIAGVGELPDGATDDAYGQLGPSKKLQSDYIAKNQRPPKPNEIWNSMMLLRRTSPHLPDYIAKESLDEEGAVPTNNVGSGNIAGVGVGPDGEPGVSKKNQKKHRRLAAMTRTEDCGCEEDEEKEVFRKPSKMAKKIQKFRQFEAAMREGNMASDSRDNLQDHGVRKTVKLPKKQQAPTA